MNPPPLPESPGAPYGFCPYCADPGVFRARRRRGNDRCAAGHMYPSEKALRQPRDLLAGDAPGKGRDKPPAATEGHVNLLRYDTSSSTDDATEEPETEDALGEKWEVTAEECLREMEAIIQKLAALIAGWRFRFHSLSLAHLNANMPAVTDEEIQQMIDDVREES